MTRLIRNATVTIGTDSTLISETIVKGKRFVLELGNLNASGGNDIFVSVDEEAVTNKGRRIQPGQTITWSADGGYIPPTYQVNGISAASSSLIVYEEIEV